MTIKLGINGFGRIGRLAFRIAWDDPDVQIVGINDITDAATLAHLLKYDSVHGIFDHTISFIQTDTEMAIIVDGKQIPVFAAKDPSQIPWDVVGADIVAECTGLFTSRPKAALNQARKSDIRVILSAPAKEKTPEDHKQRKLHNKLPGTHGESHSGKLRTLTWIYDHHPQLHKRSAHT
jgi:glyceraldehyde 3-phosphate dehydrogenase